MLWINAEITRRSLLVTRLFKRLRPQETTATELSGELPTLRDCERYGFRPAEVVVEPTQGSSARNVSTRWN